MPDSWLYSDGGASALASYSSVQPANTNYLYRDNLSESTTSNNLNDAFNVNTTVKKEAEKVIVADDNIASDNNASDSKKKKEIAKDSSLTPKEEESKLDDKAKKLKRRKKKEDNNDKSSLASSDNKQNRNIKGIILHAVYILFTPDKKMLLQLCTLYVLFNPGLFKIRILSCRYYMAI